MLTFLSFILNVKTHATWWIPSVEMGGQQRRVTGENQEKRDVFSEPETADADGKQKMVGVSWHVKEDWIESSMDTVIEKAAVCKKFTKSFVMKVVASLFDPLGIHSPMMIVWDVEILGEIRVKWDKILKNLQKVLIINIPRFYLQGAGGR